MSGGVVDFLVEVPEDEVMSVLQAASSQKSSFVFKLAEFPTPLQTSIDSFFDKRVMFDKDIANVQFDLEQDVSMKFNVGTEVYFIKTKLKKYLNRVYFERTAKIMQLKRRKEPRYIVPKKWNQTAILGGIPCAVQDISLGGIRFECAEPKVVLKVNDAVRIQFQIYKRAEISMDATVRFFMTRANGPSLIGMEFKGLTDAQKDKIKTILDDIINFQSLQKY